MDRDQVPPAPPPLQTRRLLAGTIGGLVGLTVVMAALGVWLRRPLTAAGRAFVEHLGGPGIAVGFLLPDAFTIPVPNDTFLALAVAGEFPFWATVAWATAGSLAGGSLGWLLGRTLRRTARVQRFFTAGRGAALDAALRRHGVWIVALAAVTPLPYSVCAWAAGSTRMPYRVFATVSLLRVFRVAGALWLVELGLWAGA